MGLKETNKTKKLGKWFVLTDVTREQDVKDFLDLILPILFQAIDVEDVTIYMYPHFPYPRCGNYHQRKQAKETAKTLQQLNPTEEKVTKSRSRNQQGRQQRKLEVVFKYQDPEQPPAPKKVETTAWKEPNKGDNPELVSLNPWKHAAGFPKHQEKPNQDIHKQIAEAISNSKSTTQAEIRKQIDTEMESIRTDLMK